MRRAPKLIVVIGLWIIGSLWPTSAQALNQILNIRHWVAPDHTRVVIDTPDEVVFNVEKQEGRIAIELEETAFPTNIPHLLVLNKPGLESVTILPGTQSRLRVELAIPAQAQTTVFKLKRFQDKTYRIVIDIVLPDIARKESEAREQIKTTRKDRIIVIDPGHGGESLGAVGRAGTFEKDVVLSISRKLRDILNRRPGYRAFLTRDGDYYVSFKKRLRIAREYGAELFVSIHADAAKNRAAMGSSVYCLSMGGASSEAARILARSENLADIVGGVPNGEGSDETDPIILNMFQTHAINQSRTFGAGLLRHLGTVNRLKFKSIQEAPFIVLKLPEIPSVLIETAYISNPKEEKFLRNDRFQTRLAENIARSIGDFLPPLPPVVTTAAVTKKGKPSAPETVKDSAAEEGGDAGAGITKEQPTSAETTQAAPVKIASPVIFRGRTAEYQVKAGDTLYRIAREYGTSVELLISLNRIDPGDSLAVGTVLRIPGRASAGADNRGSGTKAKGTGATKEKKVIHRVKKGETLAAIARKYGTTVRQIETLNRLKPSDPLYVDRKLIVPGHPSL